MTEAVVFVKERKTLLQIDIYQIIYASVNISSSSGSKSFNPVAFFSSMF